MHRSHRQAAVGAVSYYYRRGGDTAALRRHEPFRCQTGVDDTEDNNAGDSYGVVPLDTEDLSTFTAFADITEANVISWVEAALGEEQVTSLKASIDAQIAEKITPTVVTKQIGV